MMYMYLKNFKKKKYRFVHVTFMYYMYTHVYIPACELSLYQKVQRSLYLCTTVLYLCGVKLYRCSVPIQIGTPDVTV